MLKSLKGGFSLNCASRVSSRAAYALLFSLASNVSLADTIDFESLQSTSANEVTIGTSYTEGDWLVSYTCSSQLAIYGTQNANFAGSTALHGTGGFGCSTRISRTDGELFDATSLQMVKQQFSNFANINVTVFGRFPFASGKPDVSQGFVVAGNSSSFQNFVLDDQFHDLQSMRLGMGGSPSVQIDNVNLSFPAASTIDVVNVPVPALFVGAGFVLLALVFSRRASA